MTEDAVQPQQDAFAQLQHTMKRVTEGQMSNTRKGFDITIKAFIPFDPEDMFNDTPAPKNAVREIQAEMEKRGFEQIVVKQPVYRAKKKANGE
jgi:hypothetical protein